MTRDETDLVADAQAGDRSAFAELIEIYWERLYRTLWHWTRDPHAAEDMTQESFMRAFAALDSFRPGSNFRAWLFRIAHNHFVNQLRSAKRSRHEMPEDVTEPAAGPVELAQGHETEARLAVAVGRLPPDFRAALMLRVQEGMSFREIAAALSTTEQTARWRVFKARQKLLAELNEPEEPDRPA